MTPNDERLRREGHMPSQLWHYCPCGRPIGYGIDHPACDFVADDLDQKPCGVCRRYRNCTCEGGPDR